MNNAVSKVRLMVMPTPKAVVTAGARKFVDAMKAHPEKFVGGVGTGNTLEACGHEIVRLVKEESLDVSGVELFGLDEYFGLKRMEYRVSYTAILRDIYCSGMGLPVEHMHVPDWQTNYPLLASQLYEAAIIEAKGIDLQLLGLGVNGHVGFNEPPARQDLLTHIEILSMTTRERNSAGFASGMVPEKAITQGIATIRRAQALMVMAYGPDKAQAVYNMLFEIPSRDCPASLLFPHRDITVMVDLEAANLFPAPYNQVGIFSLEQTLG